MLQLRAMRCVFRGSRGRLCACLVHRARAYARFAGRGARRLYASESTVTQGGLRDWFFIDGPETPAPYLSTFFTLFDINCVQKRPKSVPGTPHTPTEIRGCGVRGARSELRVKVGSLGAAGVRAGLRGTRVANPAEPGMRPRGHSAFIPHLG
eukprot:5302641-Prymnesium_polylepis.1